MTYEVVLSILENMDGFAVPDGEVPRLFRPVLYQKGDEKLCVFMEYDSFMQGIAVGFYCVDPKEKKAWHLDAEEGRDYFGMEEVYRTEVTDESLPDFDHPDPIPYFDRYLASEGEDRDALQTYREFVLAESTPDAKRFYEYFFKDM